MYSLNHGDFLSRTDNFKGSELFIYTGASDWPVDKLPRKRMLTLSDLGRKFVMQLSLSGCGCRRGVSVEG